MKKKTLVLMLAICMFSVTACSARNTKQDVSVSNNTVTENDATEDDTTNELVAIPTYDDITVSAEQPLMGFDNPIDNEDMALLRYTVDADWDSEEPISLIPEEMWIRPGKTLPIDIASQLEPGIHDVRISIIAMDPVTEEILDSSVQYITVTVE